MANKEKFIHMSVNSLIGDRFGRYSKYIIQERAIPDARDGLKPVQRRILYAMSNLNLWPDKPFKKSARIVGEVIGKFHPHGDSSIYEALVRMAQDWKMGLPLIEMHGNKGSVDNDPAAAMRYTEVRLSRIAEVMMRRIKDNTVVFTPNFDDSESEPTVLPALVPNLLVNGTTGIAAGYATEIPPHNPTEILEAIIHRIKHPKSGEQEIYKIVRGPDFPTGGVIDYRQSDISKALETGRGKIVIRARYRIETGSKINKVIIKEIPYGVVKSKLVKAIDEQIFAKKIHGLKEIRDESDKHGIRIVIEIDSKAKTETILNYLFRKTELQVNYNYNMICIDEKTPKLFGIVGLIDVYIKHQKQVVRNYLKFDFNKLSHRLEIIKGFIKVGDDPQKIIRAIEKAPGSRQGVISILKKEFKFTQVQAEAIADLRLYRLSRTDQTQYITEAAKLKSEIKTIRTLLDKPSQFNAYLIEKIEKIIPYFYEKRRSIFKRVDEESQKIDEVDLIKNEPTLVAISTQGYIKRFSHRVLDANEWSTFGLNHGDRLVHTSDTKTKNTTLIFSSKGDFTAIPNYKFKDEKWRSVGSHLNTLTKIPPGSRIITGIDVYDFNSPIYIVQFTKFGRAKKTVLSEFALKRFNNVSDCFRLSSEDELASVVLAYQDDDVVVMTKKGKAHRFPVQQIPLQSTRTQGATLVKVRKGDVVASVACGKNNTRLGLVLARGKFSWFKIGDVEKTNVRTIGKDYWTENAKKEDMINVKVMDKDCLLSYFDTKLQVFPYDKILDISGYGGCQSIGRHSSITGAILGSPSHDTLRFAPPEPRIIENEKSQLKMDIDSVWAIKKRR